MAIKREVAPISAGATLKNWEFKELGLTQQEIADRLGISRKHLSELLNDKVPLSHELAVRIEEVFNISADVLMRVESKHRLYHARLNRVAEKPVKVARASRQALEPA
ncbi:HigA family addiction module antitoxin [uncultured Microbulbifer sp.]|uniref:HigA family addiction module antitoxin n=1 Tax=uncultured Microbulbifer sp. TaxID=348147 RepID=UPI00260F9255|nr:HigA family addiction module antitoxin [uncultured Microbulbifer sp.]